jgi:hypothetical protein
MRPEVASWLAFSRITSDINIFQISPAREWAYKWLSDDLKRISMIDFACFEQILDYDRLRGERINQVIIISDTAIIMNAIVCYNDILV